MQPSKDLGDNSNKSPILSIMYIFPGHVWCKDGRSNMRQKKHHGPQSGKSNETIPQLWWWVVNTSYIHLLHIWNHPFVHSTIKFCMVPILTESSKEQWPTIQQCQQCKLRKTHARHNKPELGISFDVAPYTRINYPFFRRSHFEVDIIWSSTARSVANSSGMCFDMSLSR